MTIGRALVISRIEQEGRPVGEAAFPEDLECRSGRPRSSAKPGRKPKWDAGLCHGNFRISH